MSQILCRRCGVCCGKGGPALHASDAALLSQGCLSVQDLFCIRRGEPAHDPRQGGVHPVESELIKIRGRHPSWTCVFFVSNPAGCAMYSSRPLECRALSCTDLTALFEAMSTPHLSRWDLVGRDSGLGGCIAEHEALFPVSPALALAQSWAVSGDPGRGDLVDLVRREWHFRQAFAERVRVRDADLWPYFGRPLWMVLSPLVPALENCVG